jgi:hypothetical protein
MDLTTSDDLDVRSRPIVAIHHNRFLVVLCAVIGIAPVLALVASLAAHRLWPDRFDLNWAPGPAGWVQVAWPVLVLMILVPFAIWAGLAPGFAVFKEGIKVQVKRIPPGRSRWDPWQYGFYSWGEVSHCRWSPYQPGVLFVHLEAAEQRTAGLSGTGSGSPMRVPPMIYFYPVPERHRAAVEAAIRACGKWAG